MNRCALILLLSFPVVAGCQSVRGLGQLLGVIQKNKIEQARQCPAYPSIAFYEDGGGYWISRADQAELLIYISDLEVMGMCGFE